MKPIETSAARPKVCHVVAGPNGSGKSTFALRFLPDYAGSIEYVNPDLVAQGLSPTDIRLSAIKAGKLTLARIAELIAAGESFGFETTLSGRGHLKLLAESGRSYPEEVIENSLKQRGFKSLADAEAYLAARQA